MSERFRRRAYHLTLLGLAVAAWAAQVCAGPLPPEIEKQLESARYVYIASMRKDGTFGKPAEIWFMYWRGAVYVGSSPKSWRVRRIRWGRPEAKIWVGRRDGPSFRAVGAVVDDPEAKQMLLRTFARKYPKEWGKWEKSFRDGFEEGSRVLVKYVPLPVQAR